MGLFHWKCQPSHQGTIQLGRGCFVKSQGTKLVETSMKLLCDDSGKTKGAHEPEHLHANHRKLNLKCGAAGCEKIKSADDTRESDSAVKQRNLSQFPSLGSNKGFFVLSTKRAAKKQQHANGILWSFLHFCVNTSTNFAEGNSLPEHATRATKEGFDSQRTCPIKCQDLKMYVYTSYCLTKLELFVKNLAYFLLSNSAKLVETHPIAPAACGC